MPKPCELRQIAGAIWARLDMDWDGGPVSLYTEIEIRKLKDDVCKEIVYLINNLDRVTVRDE